MKSYSEKLKDPRWQKKRLKILERDKWTCQECGDKDNTLHVHHLKYHKSGNPWSTPLKDLQTLCEDCHEGKKDPKNKSARLSDELNKLDYPQLDPLAFMVKLMFYAPDDTTVLINILRKLLDRAFSDGVDSVS